MEFVAQPFESPTDAGEIMENLQAVFDALKPARLGKYQWRQMDPQRTHNELCEIWALVTKYPGCTLRFIAKKLDISLSRSKRLVDLLLKSGTLIRAAGSYRTLRAPIPLITIRGDTDDR